MNTEDFVTYEQALKIKKLGFKEDVNYYYENNTLTSAFESFEDPILYNIPIVVSTETLKYDFNGHDEVVISAPTLAQVQKWLLIEKKRFVWVVPIPHTTNEFGWGISLYNKIGTCADFAHSSFYSYEEALSAGITKCIELLEKED